MEQTKENFYEQLLAEAKSKELNIEGFLLLQDQNQFLGLSEYQLRAILVIIYEESYQVACEDGIVTPEEQKELDQIMGLIKSPSLNINAIRQDLFKIKRLFKQNYQQSQDNFTEKQKAEIFLNKHPFFIDHVPSFSYKK